MAPASSVPNDFHFSAAMVLSRTPSSSCNFIEERQSFHPSQGRQDTATPRAKPEDRLPCAGSPFGPHQTISAAYSLTF
jgi:hypothetical protein